MISVAFMAYRKERNVVPESKMYDVTLGISASRNQYLFFKSVLLEKYSKTNENSAISSSISISGR